MVRVRVLDNSEGKAVFNGDRTQAPPPVPLNTLTIHLAT